MQNTTDVQTPRFAYKVPPRPTKSKQPYSRRAPHIAVEILHDLVNGFREAFICGVVGDHTLTNQGGSSKPIGDP